MRINYTRPYYVRYTYNRHICRRRSITVKYLVSFFKLLLALSIIILSSMFTFNSLKKRDSSNKIIQNNKTNTNTEIEEIVVNDVIMQNDVSSTERIIEYKIIEDDISFEEHLGEDEIVIDDAILRRYNTPDSYYDNLDYSSFQPWMDYRKITDTKSGAYKVCNSDQCYTDSNGMRRYKVSDNQFSIDGADDYVVALGTYYKPKDQVGLRYLVVTTTGMFTVITGDEKADGDTDSMNMFTLHKNGTYAGIIEWIVDVTNLNSDIRSSGNVVDGPIKELKGNIVYIYGIE